MQAANFSFRQILHKPPHYSLLFHTHYHLLSLDPGHLSLEEPWHPPHCIPHPRLRQVPSFNRTSAQTHQRFLSSKAESLRAENQVIGTQAHRAWQELEHKKRAQWARPPGARASEHWVQVLCSLPAQFARQSGRPGAEGGAAPVHSSSRAQAGVPNTSYQPTPQFLSCL